MEVKISIHRCDCCGKRLSDNEVSISGFLKQKQDIKEHEDYCTPCIRKNFSDISLKYKGI